MSRIKEALVDVVHFRTRVEARNLHYSFDPKREAFGGQFYPVEEIRGNVRGQKIDLEVLHLGEGEHMITGKVGEMHAGYEPDKGMKIFDRYARHLRRKEKLRSYSNPPSS